jgi:hypothetical protein
MCIECVIYCYEFALECIICANAVAQRVKLLLYEPHIWQLAAHIVGSRAWDNTSQNQKPRLAT